MKRVRARVRELTLRRRCHEDLRGVIASLNPVLRGWGQYFRTGNASRQFLTVDLYVVDRLRSLLRKRHNLRHPAGHWRVDFFQGLGLHCLGGTVRYPGAA